MGDGTRFEIGRANSLEGSTPSPSAAQENDCGGVNERKVALAERSGVGLPNRTGGFDSLGPLSGIG
jgi:hypothetical protein